MFIALEGMTGSGKTTLAAELEIYLRNNGHDVVRTREPGGTPYGEAIRNLIVKHELPPELDLALYLEMKRDHEMNLILPALEMGKYVISDRFTGAFIAYRNARKGMALEALEAEVQKRTTALRPTVTLMLDVEPEVGLQRKIEQGQVSWFDWDIDAATKERHGYHILAARYGWNVIPTGFTQSEQLQYAIEELQQRLG